MLPFLNIKIEFLFIILITVDSTPNLQVNSSIIIKSLSYKSLNTCKAEVGDTWQKTFALGATIGLYDSLINS